MKTNPTLADYIDHVGRAALISRLGLSTKQISEAKRADKFPSSWYRSMLELARKTNRDDPPLGLFNWRETPADMRPQAPQFERSTP